MHRLICLGTPFLVGLQPWAPMANRRKVTVIDDDRSVLKATERLLCARGFEVETFASAEAFLACTATRPTTCLVLDIKLGSCGAA